MHIGLLWYDGDPRRSLEDKIGRAARRYLEKYGRWPNTCYVHPQAAAGNGEGGLRVACQSPGRSAPIRVLSAPNILLHHLWLGESQEETASE